jgi:hypothetical protein
VASWAFLELVEAELGDWRLTNRLIRLVEAMAEQPEATIPQACGTSGAKAAYRFFDNPCVDAGKILEPHVARTALRAAEHQVVLAPQDTTTLSLTHHPSTRGTGYITSNRKTRGLLLHSTMVLSPQGTPLGMVDQQIWARSLKDYGKAKKAREKLIQDKESQCWLNSLEAVQQALPEHPQVVVIGDQESDIFDLFAASRRPGVDLLVRVCRTGRRVDDAAKYLNQAIAQSPVRGTVTIQLPRGDDRPTRQAVLSLRWGSYTILPPRHHPQRRQLSPITLQFILAEEEHPPAGQEPVRWFLVTTLPVKSLEDAVQFLRWYSYRWRIERFHFVFKSGCKIEQLQLETVERLQRAISCYSIVAWRLLWLTYEARERPDNSCAEILETHEWRSLHATVHPDRPVPKQPPTVREAVRMVAQLGGFLGRKQDGEPGVKTIWRGLRRLSDISRTWELVQRHARERCSATCG